MNKTFNALNNFTVWKVKSDWKAAYYDIEKAYFDPVHLYYDGVPKIQWMYCNVIILLFF